MKITIRFSILSILLLLLLTISLSIIGINYFNLQKTFIATSKSYISQASSRISAQVTAYLSPLKLHMQFVADLITNQNITPENSIEFFKFFNKAISGETGINAIKWGDINGNYYKLHKNEVVKDNFNSIAIINNGETRTMITTTYDANMNLLDSKQNSIDYDPQLREWYQVAKLTKKNIWLISPLLDLDLKIKSIGVTSSLPIYDAYGNLRGVLAAELPLTTISDFVKSIHVTTNSVVFICDDLANLISASITTMDSTLTETYQMPKLTNLKMPWVTESYNLFFQKKQPVFTFKFNNKEYLAAYNEIPTTKGYRKWFVAVVTPIQDIIAPLQKNMIFSLLLVTIALFIGVILSVFFSSKISTPINELAQDAELICKLQLSSKKIFSRIKEIDLMGDAFAKMKNALQSFQRYMPIAIVKNLISSGKVATVGGETKEISMVFTDIENFTTISEKMSPQDLMLYLSEYFQVVAKIVRENYGTIDKYIGDGVMALWGTPLDDTNHAAHTCQAVLKIINATKILNEKWKMENKPAINTRIGINTGVVVVGNVDSDDRLSYTVIGDAVNVASRLEKLNKVYGTYTIVSEFTYKKVKNLFDFRLLDKVMVKGKQQKIYVYELLGEKNQKTTNESDYNKDFSVAFNHYEQGNWQPALDEFTRLITKYPNDKIIPLFITRCNTLLANPPKNWTGIWTSN